MSLKQEESASEQDISFSEFVARVPLRESLLALAVVVFLGTRLGWFVEFGTQYDPRFSVVFAKVARHGIDKRETVYKDIAFEYPPLAWWFSAVPRLIDWNSYPNDNDAPEDVVRCRNWYFHSFHVECLLADIFCFGLIVALGRLVSPRAEWLLPIGYCLVTVAQPYLIFDSFDLGLCAFFLAFCYCWLRSTEAGAATDLWALLAYAILGCGISYKIMPILLVPFAALGDWRAGCGLRKGFARGVALATTAAGPFLIHFALAGPGVFDLFRYHSQRGLQFESFWGSTVLARSALGVPCQVVWEWGSYDVVGGATDACRTPSRWIAPGLMAAVWGWTWWKRLDRRATLWAGICAVELSAAFSYVYSPQYALWLLPLALLAATNLFGRRWLPWALLIVFTTIILSASCYIWPNHFEELSQLQPLFVSLSIVRSVSLVGLAGLLAWEWFAATRCAGGAAVQ
ncbi:MAG TPA: hypothetical protein VMF30_15040 [Pirellulales bacterium]|nr:hypothetical protein [Pirellulales bacterium]